jgi:hypothetical protein
LASQLHYLPFGSAKRFLFKEIVMKKSLILTSALVLSMSSVAMADSFSFGARASVSFGTRTPAKPVVIRDHRNQTPVYQTQYANPTRYGSRWENQQPQPYQPIPAGLDCRNWDPSVDASNACAAYSTGYVYEPRVGGAWTLLGVRESSVADNQFITVGDGRYFGQLKLRAEQGSPVITKVAVRFMDNSTQVINIGGRLDYRASMSLSLHRKPINQIVIYTAAGSRGAYSVTAAQ